LKNQYVVNYDYLEGAQQISSILAYYGLQLKEPVDKAGIFELANILDQIKDKSNGSEFEEILRKHNLFVPREDFPGSGIWPRYDESDSRKLSNVSFAARRMQVITKTTPIVSLGSCFAIEIARWLQVNKFNYIVTEPNVRDDGYHGSSAKWGTIFNAPALSQVIRWAFNEDKPPLIVYPLGNKFRDPFREDIEYEDEEVENLANLWQTHLKCSYEALSRAEVVIATVGLNEVYEYLPSSHYLHRTPWRLNPFCWKEKVLTVEENVFYLSRAITTLRRYNPLAKFIFSVSPVPLFRTFREHVHVVEATAHSKAVLRVAVEQTCAAFQGCFYMPSFERVMYPGEETPWDRDYRHVNRSVVEKIMNTFELMFCK
jgi:hypothetical protein